MRPSFLFISNGYPPALEYFKISEINESYDSYKIKLSSRLLDIAYLYSLGLNKLGCFARAVIPNHKILQEKWARENRIKFSDFSPPHLVRRSLLLNSFVTRFPKVYYFFKNILDKKTWNWQILMAQIKGFRPDILQIFDLHYFSPKFLKEAKRYVRKIVGEISSPIMIPRENLKCYDIIFSSMPHFVKEFREMGISSFYLPYAFEPEVFKIIGKPKRKYDCVYVGGLGRNIDKTSFLERAAEKANIDFWGYTYPPPDKSSPIWPKYHGQAWGIEMFKILAQSKIVVNCHTQKIGKYFASKYANNMRLYEATGMGAMLITDFKENLGELFEIGKEVETYNSLEELVEKINYYLKHDEEREKIARAGQERTLKDHTFEVRARKILEIIKSC